ncbi:MAG: c-type cytochrome [Granulosicoccus sp.]
MRELNLMKASLLVLILASVAATIPAMAEDPSATISGHNKIDPDDTAALARVLSDTELSALPAIIMEDGTGLPGGQGNAERGEEIYNSTCVACHGPEGQGGTALELVGDRSLLATEFPDRGIAVYWPYAPPLFGYIRRAMPPDKPWSLEVDDVYSVIAYILEVSELADPGQIVDAAFLSSLEMPNRDGFRSRFD